MLKLFKSLPFLFLLFALPLVAEQKIIGSNLDVDILTQDIIGPTGQKIGNDFFAYNRNPHNVIVTITMTNGTNVLDQLYRGKITVIPGASIPIGRIVQADPAQEWRWYVEWVIEPQ